MKKIMLASVLSLIMIATPVLALNISVSTDKVKVFMGDTITLTGKITYDNGSTTTFDYRAAVVAPKKILVCDSNRTKTAADGTFSLACKLPTAQEAANLGIPASDSRSVIPYVAGVAVKDPTKNATVKRHAQAVITVNQDKFAKEVDGISKSLDEFTTHARNFVPECDAIAEKAVRYNITDVATKCLEIQQRINDMISNSTELSDSARQLRSSINATNMEDFRDSLKTLKEDMKDLRDEIKNLKETIKSIRWEVKQEVKKSSEDVRKEIEEKRSEIKEKRMEIKELRNRTRGAENG